MDKNQALVFLTTHQPIRAENELRKIIRYFHEASYYFQCHPDPACVPVFLNCFGHYSNMGIYTTIENILLEVDRDIVLYHLNEALYSQCPAIRYWCARLAQTFFSPQLIDGLIYVYEQGDLSSQCAALTALSDIRHRKVENFLEQALTRATDTDLLVLLKFVYTQQAMEGSPLGKLAIN